jgi:hypothetical protein
VFVAVVTPSYLRSGKCRRELLASDVDRLNEVELDILNYIYIALERGPVSMSQLHEDLVQHPTGVRPMDALESLLQHHLIESTPAGYEQAPALSASGACRVANTSGHSSPSPPPRSRRSSSVRMASSSRAHTRITSCASGT